MRGIRNRNYVTNKKRKADNPQETKRKKKNKTAENKNKM